MVWYWELWSARALYSSAHFEQVLHYSLWIDNVGQTHRSLWDRCIELFIHTICSVGVICSLFAASSRITSSILQSLSETIRLEC